MPRPLPVSARKGVTRAAPRLSRRPALTVTGPSLQGDEGPVERDAEPSTLTSSPVAPPRRVALPASKRAPVALVEARLRAPVTRRGETSRFVVSRLGLGLVPPVAEPGARVGKDVGVSKAETIDAPRGTASSGPREKTPFGPLKTITVVTGRRTEKCRSHVSLGLAPPRRPFDTLTL